MKKPSLKHHVIECSQQTIDQQAIVGQSFTESLDLHRRLSEQLDLRTFHQELSALMEPTQAGYRLHTMQEFFDPD